MENEEDTLSRDGFNAWIMVDGEKATNYCIEHGESDKGATVSCWIASTENKEFAVGFSKVADGYSTVARICLDKTEVTYVITQKTSLVSSTRISETESRTFVFAPLELTDDDTYLEQSRTQDIGTIELELSRATDNGPGVEKPTFFTPVLEGKLHERTKKCLSHRVHLGPVVQSGIDNRPKRKVTMHGGKLVTFIFKYRPLDVLQANGIAPRPQSQDGDDTIPVKEEPIDVDEEDKEDSDEERERELLAQLELVRRRKREKEDDPHAKKKVKKEPRHFTPGEVIDLTR